MQKSWVFLYLQLQKDFEACVKANEELRQKQIEELKEAMEDLCKNMEQLQKEVELALKEHERADKWARHTKLEIHYHKTAKKLTLQISKLKIRKP